MLANSSPLTRRLVLFWLPIFALFFGMAYFSQMRYNPEQEAKSGLDRLNHWRKQAGLQPFDIQEQLKSAAQKHALYLSQDAHGHDELNPRNPHFSGKNPQERATAVAYAAPIAENLTISNFARSGRRSADGLMTALYHRLSLLNPDHNEAGSAWSRGKNSAFVVKQGSRHDRELCNNHLNSKNTSSARYILTTECLGQKVEIPLMQLPPHFVGSVKFPIGNNIMPIYNGTEQPNPMPNHKHTGNPISIAFYGQNDKIEMLSFQLFEPQGEVQNTHILTAQNDPNKQLSETEFALFPIEPLKFETDYRATFRYRQNNEEKTETWQFKTRKKRHFLE